MTDTSARTPIVAARGRRSFEVAGLGVEVEANVSCPGGVRLSSWLTSFASSPPASPDLRLVIGARGSLRPSPGPVLCDYSAAWRLRLSDGRPLYEFFHPPSGRTIAAARAASDFSHYEVLYDEGTWGAIAASCSTAARRTAPLMFSSPMDQLLFVPRLAGRGGFLVHACGAVIGGRSYVFAGHSGDGKTTLARVLASEGVEVLSDERVAVRRVNGAFMAFGTPWPGEGGVVSRAGAPLAGVFLLRKGTRHRLIGAGPAVSAAELISRSVVPYYLPDEAESVLTLVQGLSDSLPIKELEFAPRPGLVPLLLQAA